MTEATKTPQERIDELERVINNTREEFIERVSALQLELNSLRESIQSVEEPVSEKSVGISVSYTAKESATPIKLPVESQAQKEPELNQQSTPEPVLNPVQKKMPLPAESGWNEPADNKAFEPNAFDVFLNKFFATIFYFILSRLSIFIAPMQGLFHKVIKLYDHYKDQGKAPVFLMTVAGLLTLTVGFGYLLQYSFYTLFNDALKAITGFVIGISIIGVGVLLAKKKTDFREYAASVIALGIIFNYLTAFFIGPYYGIVSDTTGFVLLMLITLASFSLALIYETKVVAFVTLLGGALMPLVVGQVESVGLVFVLYLFFLSCANLYLSYKINWASLSHITFVLSLSILEYTGISTEINPLITMLLLTGFFYVYVYYWSFDGIKIKEKLSRYDLTLLVSNVFYFLYSMLQVSTDNTTVASVLFLHAVLLAVIVFSLQLLKTALAPVYLLMIGLLIATSAFVLAPVDVTSVIWAIEGLVLLYIGFQYQHKIIRVEGYAIYLVAMLMLLWQLLNDFSSITSSVTTWYWFGLVSFGVLSFVAYRLVGSFKDITDKLEIKAAFVVNEVFTLWGVLSMVLVLDVFMPALKNILLIVPVAWCFYRVSIFRLRFSQVLGFSVLVVLFLYILQAMFYSNTSVISMQTANTWILLAEVLVVTWGLNFYYLRSNIQGRGQLVANKLHQLVFYVPVVLLLLNLLQIGIVHVAESQQLAFGYLWFDFVIVGVLLLVGYWVVNKTESLKEGEIRLFHNTVLSETGSLYLSAFFLYTVAILFNEWMFNLAVVPLLYLLHRSIKEKLPLTEKLAWAHFSFFAVMTWLSYNAVGNLHFSEQSWSTQIAWGELLICAWGMRMVYDRLESKDGLYGLAVKLRIAVYLLIPLLFLPRIFRLYAEYLPVFIWLSFAISWLMYKKLKIKQLLMQLTVLFFVALTTTVLMTLNAVTGAHELPGIAALITGVLVVSIFHYFEKTLQQNSSELSTYINIQLVSPYFYGFALMSFTYALTSVVTLSLLIGAAFFLFIIQQRRLLIVMRQSIRLAYLLVWAGLVTIPVLVFTQVESSTLSVLVSFVAITGLWYVTHQDKAILIVMQRKHMARNVQFWLFHALVFIVYTGVLNLMFESWSVGTSIAMLMHAVVVLFLTLNDDFKALLRLSIVLYALTAAKVLFHDMNDFSHIHKVIALMCMGSILMLAAYFFQRARNNRVISTC